MYTRGPKQRLSSFRDVRHLSEFVLGIQRSCLSWSFVTTSDAWKCGTSLCLTPRDGVPIFSFFSSFGLVMKEYRVYPASSMYGT